MAYTTYYVVGPSSGWSDPTATEIKAGQLSGGGAATASGSEASLGASGTHTFATPASGLSSTVSYKIAFVASDGSTDSNVVVSEAIHKGTGALTIGATTASGSGTVAHTGTGALTTGATTASGVGVLSHTGTGALTVGSTTASGSGTVTSPGVITGTGALTTSSVTASGSGVIAHTGNGAILISDIVVSGAGVLSHNGTGAITTNTTTLSGTGNVLGTITGTGALTIANVIASGYDVIQQTEEAPAGGGKGSSRKKRVIYERIEDVEDFVEAMESEVLQEPKVKAKLRKVKKLKPETVENTEESANAWIEYYQDLLQALRDQERADQIRRDLEKSSYMLQTVLRNREMQDLMRIEAMRQEENLILLLMAA